MLSLSFPCGLDACLAFFLGPGWGLSGLGGGRSPTKISVVCSLSSKTVQPRGSSKCEEAHRAVRAGFRAVLLAVGLWPPHLASLGLLFSPARWGLWVCGADQTWRCLQSASHSLALGKPSGCGRGGCRESLNPGVRSPTPPRGGVQVVCPWGLRGGPLPAGHRGPMAGPPATAYQLWPQSPGLGWSRALPGCSLGPTPSAEPVLPAQWAPGGGGGGGRKTRPKLAFMGH